MVKPIWPISESTFPKVHGMRDLAEDHCVSQIFRLGDGLQYVVPQANGTPILPDAKRIIDCIRMIQDLQLEELSKDISLPMSCAEPSDLAGYWFCFKDLRDLTKQIQIYLPLYAALLLSSPTFQVVFDSDTDASPNPDIFTGIPEVMLKELVAWCTQVRIQASVLDNSRGYLHSTTMAALIVVFRSILRTIEGYVSSSSATPLAADQLESHGPSLNQPHYEYPYASTSNTIGLMASRPGTPPAESFLPGTMTHTPASLPPQQVQPYARGHLLSTAPSTPSYHMSRPTPPDTHTRLGSHSFTTPYNNALGDIILNGYGTVPNAQHLPVPNAMFTQQSHERATPSFSPADHFTANALNDLQNKEVLFLGPHVKLDPPAEIYARRSSGSQEGFRPDIQMPTARSSFSGPSLPATPHRGDFLDVPSPSYSNSPPSEAGPSRAHTYSPEIPQSLLPDGALDHHQLAQSQGRARANSSPPAFFPPPPVDPPPTVTKDRTYIRKGDPFKTTYQENYLWKPAKSPSKRGGKRS